MSKVSVIIIAYNVKEYISKAISSAIAQTLEDIEIVVVDDHSTDGTFEIITEYAKRDKRIKVARHEENKSIIIARRTGLKNATGECVMYLDGDDKLARNACERAYSAITENDVDIAQFDFDMLFVPPLVANENTEREHRASFSFIDHKVVSTSKAGLIDEEAIGGTINFNVWNKIYRRELLEKAFRDIPSEYINMAEDWLFSFIVQYYAHSYVYLPERVYIYRFGCGMSTAPKMTDRVLKFIAKNAFVYSFLDSFAKKQDAEAECRLALHRVYKALYHHIAGTLLYNTSGEQKKLFISEIIKWGTPANLVLGLSAFIYEHNVTPELIADECAMLDIFAAKKTKAETIGIYYHRIYNGGVEKVMSLLTDIWVKAGYRVVLFTDEEPNEKDYYINPAIKRVTVPAMQERDYFNRKARIDVFSKALEENGVDIMVYNAWENSDLVLDEMIIKSLGIKLIIHTHNIFCGFFDDVYAYGAYYHSTIHKLYSFADSVIALNDVDAEWWRLHGLRVFKTKNPIEFKRDIEPAPLGGNNILLVARIAREKRILEAIKIAALVREKIPNATLTIVGSGDDEGYANEVANYIDSNHLKKVVKLVGFKADVLPYYQSADVMLFTSRIEGSPLAMLEGKICGIPLVTYELPNLDMIREGKGMIVVPQLDTEGAAEAVIKILSDSELKKEMGRQARKSAEEFYDFDLSKHWDMIFEQTLLPMPEPKPLSELPASDVAMRIATDSFSRGIYLRSVVNAPTPGSNGYSPLREELDMARAEIISIRRSETYRVGYLILLIPRKLKDLIKKLLGR